MNDGQLLRLIFWETTAACNLACVHCRRIEAAHQFGHDDLGTDQAMALVRSARVIGQPILVFSGGEPLMRPDLFDVAETARDVGLPTALATNGTLIDEAVAQRIINAGFRRVSVSLDGPDAATHDEFRGINGAFDAALRGLGHLRAGGMSVQINTTITRSNHLLLDQMYELAERIGADALHLFMLVPVGCGMELDPSVMLSGGEYERALRWIADRSESGPLQLKATCAPHYFRILAQHRQRNHASKHETTPQPSGAPPSDNTGRGGMHTLTKGCLAGQSVCFVSHRGQVFPCGYLPVECGNIKDQPLETIWRDSQVFASLRDDSQLTGKCGCCEYKAVCMGCRARAYAHSGDWLAEEPNCAYVPDAMRR